MIDPTTLRETNRVLLLLDLPTVRPEEFDGMRTLMAQFREAGEKEANDAST